MNRWTKRDHARATFRTCPKPCIGGRMTWQWAEPQWQHDLGLVGICTHCGTQVFTSDILNGPEQPVRVRFSPRFAMDAETAEARRARRKKAA